MLGEAIVIVFGATMFGVWQGSGAAAGWMLVVLLMLSAIAERVKR
jgi:hypothetical protein